MRSFFVIFFSKLLSLHWSICLNCSLIKHGTLRQWHQCPHPTLMFSDVITILRLLSQCQGRNKNELLFTKNITQGGKQRRKIYFNIEHLKLCCTYLLYVTFFFICPKYEVIVRKQRICFNLSVLTVYDIIYLKVICINKFLLKSGALNASIFSAK